MQPRSVEAEPGWLPSDGRRFRLTYSAGISQTDWWGPENLGPPPPLRTGWLCGRNGRNSRPVRRTLSRLILAPTGCVRANPRTLQHGPADHTNPEVLSPPVPSLPCIA